MDIAEWRLKIDELDRQLVALINERAHCAEEIGKLKRNSSMPIYEPDRERIIFDNIAAREPGPADRSAVAPDLRAPGGRDAPDPA